EKRDKHLVHGRIRECAEKYGAGNALHDFGNHLGFAGAWRSPDEMEDGTVHGTLDGLLLAAIQTRAERRDYRVSCRTVAVGRNPLLGKGGDFARFSPSSQDRALLIIHRRNEKIIERGMTRFRRDVPWKAVDNPRLAFKDAAVQVLQQN